MPRSQFAQERLDLRFDREAHSWKHTYATELNDSHSWSRYPTKLYRKRYVLEMVGRPRERHSSSPRAPRVLDLGCGPGGFMRDLVVLGYDVTGVDASREMVTLAMEAAKSMLPRPSVVRGDALKLPFAGETFDVVISVGLLEYLPDDGDLLEEIRRVLRPGGQCVFTLRNAQCIERRLWRLYGHIGLMRYPPDYYFREHQVSHFQAVAEQSGFETVETRYCHFYPLPWPASRWLRRLNNFLSHPMERLLSRRQIPFLGSTIILGLQKKQSGSAVPPAETLESR